MRFNASPKHIGFELDLRDKYPNATIVQEGKKRGDNNQWYRWARIENNNTIHVVRSYDLSNIGFIRQCEKEMR